ncbi:MAG: exosortase/archaeosortase family protein [Pirellulales bacterium]|nr:exosortase/archaeosortase family protein [Pirellulales bacterium]
MSTSSTAAPAPSWRADSPAGWWGWTAWGLLAAALGVMYRDSFVQLVNTWENDPNYSHGFFIPLVCAYLTYLGWQQVGPPFRANVPRQTVLLGVLEIALGFMIHLAGWFVAQPLFDLLGLVFILRGFLLAMGGNEVSRGYSFAVFFLLFAAPLPMAIYQPLAVFLQELVSVVSTFVLEVLQIPVYREGYKLQLSAGYLEVGPACSGTRQITAFLALGVILAHLSDRGRAYKWVVGMMGLPIAIATNCVRVLVTAFILLLFGREWAEGVFHTIEGLLMLVLGTVLMVATALFLANLDDAYGWGGRRQDGNSETDATRADGAATNTVATEPS